MLCPHCKKPMLKVCEIPAWESWKPKGVILWRCKECGLTREVDKDE